MFLALLLLFSITAGGFALTYLFEQDASFFARCGAGIVVGQVIFSLFGFLFGSIIGMSAGVVFLAAVLSIFPLLILMRKNFKYQARRDFSSFLTAVKNFVLRPTFEQAIWATIYAALTILLWFFFERAMLNINGGIGTGSPHNTGDLSFHLQAIYGFFDGQNLPPQNPSFAETKFTYPFMADLITAMLAAINVKISQAMFWQNVFLTVALIVLMHRFTLKLTNNIFAANIAPLILLLSGGLGFVLFFRDALASEAGVFGLLMKMPENYTIRSESGWRWGNTLTVLFMTQRSLLLGLPLALIILTKLWEVFVGGTRDEGQGASQSEDNKNLVQDYAQTHQLLSSAPRFSFLLPLSIVGLLAGALPLVHAHSFAVLMGMTSLLALMSFRRWREWTTFFASAAIVAVPELLWATINSATKARSFVDWEFGWDSNNTNVVFFWLKNTGFFIPLLFAAIALLVIQSVKFKVQAAENEESKIQNSKSKISLLLFWLPFALCFIVPNVVRLAPWIWDNIKVLVYWFVVSIPLVAWFLAQVWQRGQIGKTIALSLLFGLTLAGFLDVFRVASRQMEYTVFAPDAVAFAREARRIVPPGSVVASAPVHDSPAALMGRRWFLGFTGHVWSHGIDPNPREITVRQIYFGDDDAEKLLRENNIQYLVVSSQERYFTVVNDTFLRRYPVVAQVGDYSLLQIK